jgi:hypothetical protein
MCLCVAEDSSSFWGGKEVLVAAAMPGERERHKSDLTLYMIK